MKMTLCWSTRTLNRTNLFMFSDDLEEILENLDKIKPLYESIHDNLEFIEKQIKGVLNR